MAVIAKKPVCECTPPKVEITPNKGKHFTPFKDGKKIDDKKKPIFHKFTPSELKEFKKFKKLMRDLKQLDKLFLKKTPLGSGLSLSPVMVRCRGRRSRRGIPATSFPVNHGIRACRRRWDPSAVVSIRAIHPVRACRKSPS